MTAGEFCLRTVVICSPGDTITEAALRMRNFHVGSLVVVEEQRIGHRAGRRPVAMVSDRDIVVGPVADGFTDTPTLPVSTVMSNRLVSAREDEPLEDCLHRMRAFGVRRLPVVDLDGLLLGIVTFDDVLAELASELGDLSELLGRERRHEEHQAPAH